MYKEKMTHMVSLESDRKAVIHPVDLGGQGINYVKSRLSDSGPVAALVDEKFGSKSVCFAPLEQGVSLEQASQFSVGALMPTVAIRKWLANYIEEKWGSEAQIVFIDPWKKPQDFKNPNDGRPHFFIGSTPHHQVRQGDIYDRLTNGGKGIVTRNFVALVVSPPLPVPSPGTKMEQEYAERLAQNTCAVLAAAYDHEGYVVWEE